MGSYTFRWEHPADEVYVTGTFDDWSKSTKLDRVGSAHEKTVALSNQEKILYKFVADGDWKHDHTAQHETDHDGNVNNVLYPTDIHPPEASAFQPTISSVAPGATTTTLAGEQPVEEKAPAPGAFPETPLDSAEPTYSVNPIPASSGLGNPIQLAPGEKLPDLPVSDSTLTSNVHDDPELKSKDQAGEQTFGVAPLPATGGIGNPVQLQPGEKVPDPSTLTGNTIGSNVKLDKDSYERSDAAAPVVAPAGAAQSRDAAAASAVFGLGPQTTNIIPESSLPMGKDVPADMGAADVGPTISSVAPGSTTNQLAGQVPMEPRAVPEVVSDSQKEADQPPEAAANPTAVQDKKAVEGELQQKVPEASATSEPGLLGKSEGGLSAQVAGGVAAAGAATAGAAVAANDLIKDKTGVDAKSQLPASAQKAIDENAKPSATHLPTQEAASSVPTEVVESQKLAHESPEAAANPAAVTEKNEVEKQLLSQVQTSDAKGEPAPTESAATATTVPSATTAPPQVSVTGAPQIGHPTGGGLAPISMDEKDLNANKDTPAVPANDRVGQLASSNPTAGVDSRDVSPMTKPTTADQTQPTVTTGVGSSATASESKANATTPQKRQSIVDKLKGTPESASTSDDGKKEKRKSLFARIKDKLKN